MESCRQRSVWGRLGAMVILAAALGYIEAALVVYLRELIAPLREKHFPQAADELLPLLTLDQLRAAGPDLPRILVVEVSREPAPLVLLAAAAWGFRRRRGDLVGFFLIGFALWDIFYYVFLKVLLDWPASLATWDILYLIPTAWVAPVWAPLGVSATLLAIGMVLVLRREAPGKTGRSVAGWVAVLAGTGVVLMSFLLRTREAFEAVPARYDWWWFLVGWSLGVFGAARLLWTGARPRQ